PSMYSAFCAARDGTVWGLKSMNDLASAAIVAVLCRTMPIVKNADPITPIAAAMIWISVVAVMLRGFRPAPLGHELQPLRAGALAPEHPQPRRPCTSRGGAARERAPRARSPPSLRPRCSWRAAEWAQARSTVCAGPP